MQLHGKPCKSPKYVPSGRLWPSGDFSVGSKKIDGDDRVELDTMEHWNSTGALTIPRGWGYGRYGVPHPGTSPWWNSLCKEHKTAFLKWGAPLDLADGRNPHNSSNRPDSYGRQGITGYGRKMVRSACCLLERSYRGRLTFCTITMPTLPLEQRIALAEQWPEFVRQLLQWLSRRLQAQKLPKAIASVTEIQPKRLRAGNGGYLHLHLVWPNARIGRGHWAIDVDACRTWVETFLLNRGLLPEGEWVNVDTQRVYRSAAAYLSKYMSKGGDVLEAFVSENGWTACPKQWWNLTKPMRDAVKAELLEGTDIGELLRMSVEYAFDCNDFSHFWYLHHVDMEVDGRSVNVGWFGALKDEIREHFTTLCRAGRDAAAAPWSLVAA